MVFIWLRRYIRRNFKPMDADTAMKYKQALSAAYAIVSANLLILVVYKSAVFKAEYSLSKESLEEKKKSPGTWWARQLNVENPMVVKISGMDLASIEVRKPKEAVSVEEDVDSI